MEHVYIISDRTPAYTIGLYVGKSKNFTKEGHIGYGMRVHYIEPLKNAQLIFDTIAAELDKKNLVFCRSARNLTYGGGVDLVSVLEYDRAPREQHGERSDRSKLLWYIFCAMIIIGLFLHL